MDRQMNFGLERIKLELVFILAGGEKVDRNFSFDRQRDYYIKEIFGGPANVHEIVYYGKQSRKLVFEYMFPNNPAGVRSFKLLVRVFAGQFLLKEMYRANDFAAVTAENFVRNILGNAYQFSDAENEEIFSREIEDLHSHYVKNISAADYQEFRNLMDKFSAQFDAAAEAVENFVTKKKSVQNSPALERAKIDLLFILAGGEKVDRNFSFDQQRTYYIKEIFGNLDNETEIVNHGKQFKLSAEYMFPNSPAKLNSRKFFFELLADCIFFNQIYLADSYDAFSDKDQFQSRCFEDFIYDDADAEELFKSEIRAIHSQYLRAMTAADYAQFVNLLKKFYEPFEKILQAVKAAAADKCAVKVVEKNDAFSILCRKLAIEDAVIFKLKVDALAEIQVGNNTYVSYFESLQSGWKEKFPQYEYCDELENYIRQEKFACLLAFGNKLNTIRQENNLFDLLAAVRVKLALSDGAANFDDLKNILNQKAEKFSYAELKNAFLDSVKKSVAYYSLNNNANYSAQIKDELIPYRAGLLFVEEILLEEISRRTKKVDAVKTSSAETERAKYDLIISQKDEEIHNLQRELAYFNNLKSNEFLSGYSGYDEALMKLFRRLCDSKYGAPLNELYLLSQATEIKLDDLKHIVQNLLFIFGSLDIRPYETKNLGKPIEFESEDANTIYAVNEKEVADGLNEGNLKYPGWKLRGQEIVLPLIVMKKEEKPNE